MQTGSPLSKIALHDIRLSQGLTIKEAAETAGISVSEMSWYERNSGETPLHVAVRLSKLYSVPLNQLSFTTTKNTKNKGEVYMSNFQMIDSNSGEVMHLFEVMKNNGVTCSLELKLDKLADPFIGISNVNVDVEYVEGHDGDTLVVNMGETEFSFSLGDHDFSKFVSDSQIMAAISSKDGEYIAWFDSGTVTPAGIVEANNYDDTIGDDEPFTVDEKELIYYLRALEFDDVLDAITGIEYEVDQSKKKAALHFREGNTRAVNGFDERASKLTKLADLIGKANKDYVAHIDPEAGE